MRLLSKLPLPLFLLITFAQFFSCTSTKNLVTNSQEDLIVGKWVLHSASFNGQEIPGKVLGNISFEFSKEGIATFVTPEGTVEKGRYEIKANQLIDPDSPEEIPADIVSLTKDQFVMAMTDEGEQVTMTFVPDLE